MKQQFKPICVELYILLHINIKNSELHVGTVPAL